MTLSAFVVIPCSPHTTSRLMSCACCIPRFSETLRPSHSSSQMLRTRCFYLTSSNFNSPLTKVLFLTVTQRGGIGGECSQPLRELAPWFTGHVVTSAPFRCWTGTVLPSMPHLVPNRPRICSTPSHSSIVTPSQALQTGPFDWTLASVQKGKTNRPEDDICSQAWANKQYSC